MTASRTVLMSIKPQYAERIMLGTKRYELRRQPVRLRRDDLVIVYATAPTSAIVGAFLVEGVEAAPVDALWRRLSPDLGVSWGDYLGYFEGATNAYAIGIQEAARIAPVPLTRLRRSRPRFQPPQRYTFCREGVDDFLPPSALQMLKERMPAAGPILRSPVAL